MSKPKVCVFQDWMLELSMQQQSVLVLACRGPDGIAKFHPTKVLVAHYRASVVKSAWFGRALRAGEGTRSDPFMTLAGLVDDGTWAIIERDFFANVDSLPHHYYMHLMHGAQIIGYKHPDPVFNLRWRNFYYACCQDLHVGTEPEAEMDYRLGDWQQKHWKPEPLAAHYKTMDEHQ